MQVPIQVEDSENFLQDLLGRSVRHDVEHNLKNKTRDTEDWVFKNRLFPTKQIYEKLSANFFKRKIVTVTVKNHTSFHSSEK